MPGLKQGELFESSPPAQILLIELWPHWTECTICGEECLHRYGLAIYEDQIVPDEYQGEWGGAPACEDCFRIAAELQKENPNNFIPFFAIMQMRKRMKKQDEQMRIVYGKQSGQYCGTCAKSEKESRYSSKVICEIGKFKTPGMTEACGLWRHKA